MSQSVAISACISGTMAFALVRRRYFGPDCPFTLTYVTINGYFSLHTGVKTTGLVSGGRPFTAMYVTVNGYFSLHTGVMAPALVRGGIYGPRSSIFRVNKVLRTGRLDGSMDPTLIRGGTYSSDWPGFCRRISYNRAILAS